jgi:hypothetical protein
MTMTSFCPETAAIRAAIERRAEPQLRRLSPRLTACACCGIACEGGESETVTVGRVQVRLGRCDTCTELDVLDVAGLLLNVDRDSLSRTHPGPLRALRYATHVEPGQSAVQPWSHLVRADLVNGRRAVAAALRRRLLGACPPVQVAVPKLDGRPGDIDTGCLVCGVGTVPVSAVVADGRDPDALAFRCWRHAIISSLGPRTVRGWLCDRDAALLNDVGAIGVDLVARSLREAGLLHGSGLPARLPSFASLVIAARRTGRSDPPPNGVRWEHLPSPIELVSAGWPPRMRLVERG